ncbi:hypothetical protein [Pseudonocardia spinosispora]|uniref:hypothetical protein n=1 Tax=Pseudonocardia spinosispora TaxID=103441 RepID=UPI0004041111|nr:hypothetical protein [Pseudonocardia spinosispora]
MAKFLTGCLAVVALSLASTGTAAAAGWSGDSDAVTCIRMVQDAQSGGSTDRNSLDDVDDALSSPACRAVSAVQ